MKRAGNLYPGICDYENLCLAFYKAARGKRQRPDVIAFELRFSENIIRLRDQLINHRLDIGHYRYFTVYDPKQRSICAASFPERVLHHAVMNLCEPVFESKAIFDSYACRKGKGSYKAIARAQTFSRRFDWFLKLDIRKYFDSVDHTVMMGLLSRYFKDNLLISLFQKILDTYHLEPGKGMPIGNLISQHLANVYLTGFDHFLKENRNIKGYVRYMDDILVFGKSKEDVKAELREITAYLNEELKLQIKPAIQLNRTTAGIPFLGYRIFAGNLRLAGRSKKRLFRKFRAYERKWQTGLWSIEDLVRHMEPLINFTANADTKALRTDMIQRYGVWS